jgi:hypothetical protein
MNIVRVFTDEHGESHFQDINIDLRPARYGFLSEPIGPVELLLRRTPRGGSLGFHNPQHRQFVVTLTGAAEIGCSDGSRRVFRAGDIMLADDIAGRGHTTTELGDAGRNSLFLRMCL